MKLIRFGKRGQESPGVLLSGGRRVYASEVVSDYDEAFFANGGLDQLRGWVETEADRAPTVPDDVRLGSPVSRPSNVIGIGLNYRDHAEEADMEEPDEPVIFFKASSAVAGPNDPLVLPPGSEKTDWEVELAVVVGRRASHVSADDAMRYVAGYTLLNDYSEREYQLDRGGQWVKGKSYDGFAPMGPFLATPDEVGDVHDLSMHLAVNGETKQSSSTGEMIFGIPELIRSLSRYMTLRPGDVISTGTPAGVGMGQDPPEYLEDGDEVTLGIEGLGSATQRVQRSRVTV